MSLTMGSGPFGHSPAGRFNLEIPTTEVLFVDPSPRWIRAARDGETVVDSRRAKLLHRHGALPRYFVPRVTSAGSCWMASSRWSHPRARRASMTT